MNTGKIGAFLGAILALAIFGSCTDREDTTEESVQTVLPTEIAKVKVLALTRREFNQELISNGTIVASEKADLRFEASDIVEQIFVRNGQRVLKGDKIARLSQFKLQNALKQAEDNLEKSKLELQDVLISQGFSWQDSAKVPTETMKIAKIRSNYLHTANQYELAKYNLDQSVLYAPYAGVVANLFAKPYNIPSGSEPFCTIIGDRSLDASFSVLESELPLIQRGDQVQIAPFSLQGYTARAVIDEINPIVEDNGMVRIKARITGASQGLYEGMNIRVQVQRAAGKQLIIPKEALVLRNNKQVVFTLKDKKAFWNYVDIGLENAEGYVVTKGLQEGDLVLYEGNLNLAHETPVLVLNDAEVAD